MVQGSGLAGTRGRGGPDGCGAGGPVTGMRLASVALALALGGCSTVGSLGSDFFGGSPAEGSPGHVSGFLGGVVADEPRAALAAREVLSSGGNAADAAVALGFALSVTLPSRAGLGGGGACLAYSPARDSVNAGVPEAVLFTPRAPANVAGNADRPAAVPMLPRGLFALHARYGRRPFETLIAPAEQMARFGIPVSRAFVRDLQVVAGPLLADPNARAVFAQNGAPLTEGDRLLQPDLGSTLAQIRVSGVGDFYQGALARRVQQASPLAGGPVSVADLRASLPDLSPALTIRNGRDNVSFLPPPADGGLAAAAAFMVLQSDPNASRCGAGAGARRRGSVARGRWRPAGAARRRRAARARAGARRLPPRSLPWTGRATRWPVRSRWTICSGRAVSSPAWGSCSPPRPRSRRCRSSPRRSPGTRTSTLSARRPAAPARRARGSPRRRR